MLNAKVVPKNERWRDEDQTDPERALQTRSLGPVLNREIMTRYDLSLSQAYA